MTETTTATFECYQSADATQVVFDDGRGAVVQISRVVGNSMARALMRLCRSVLNDDLADAQQELDRMGDTGPTDEETITDEERHYAGEISRLAQFIMEEVPGEPSRSEGAVDTAIRLLSERSASNGGAFGDRVEDGGVMGTIVRCHECGGSGQLHDPDEVPEAVEPDA